MENQNKPSQDSPGNLIDLRQNDKLTKDIINDLAEKIVSGEVNACYTGVVLKRMAKVVEELYKLPAVKEKIINETKKYIEGTPKGEKIFGANILYCATSTSYDFKDCGHIVLNELNKIKKQVEEEIKLIEDELKLMIPTKSTMEIVDGKFGIKDTTKEVVISKMPSLVWETNDDVIRVKPPLKMQGFGLKFMKV